MQVLGASQKVRMSEVFPLLASIESDEYEDDPMQAYTNMVGAITGQGPMLFEKVASTIENPQVL